MPNSIQPGAIYWTIEPSMESRSHGDTEPRPPYRVKVMDDHTQRITLRCCAVDDNGNPDEDSNATAYCKPESLCEDYADALRVYCAACVAYAGMLEAQAKRIRQNLRDLPTAP